VSEKYALPAPADAALAEGYGGMVAGLPIGVVY